ncbi:MAG: VanZ family protein [bacterium]|nr:VanZ family protein [bacterium]
MQLPKDNQLPRLAPLRLWAPLLIWLTAIFVMSSFHKTFIPQSKYISWDKVAHIIEFGILGYLTARAIYFSGVRFLYRSFVIMTILLGVLYAASDEFHQYFVPGRFASVYDVMADGIGVAIGLWIFYRSIRRNVDAKSSGIKVH